MGSRGGGREGGVEVVYTFKTCGVELLSPKVVFQWPICLFFCIFVMLSVSHFNSFYNQGPFHETTHCYLNKIIEDILAVNEKLKMNFLIPCL